MSSQPVVSSAAEGAFQREGDAESGSDSIGADRMDGWCWWDPTAGVKGWPGVLLLDAPG